MVCRKNYGYPSATWRTIGGKDYCFGKDAYLFVYCYIKAADGVNYYWVDDDGVYMPEYTTKHLTAINTELLRTMPQKMHTQELLHRPIKSMPVMTIKLKAR